MQRSYRLLITAIVSVFVLYRLFSYGASRSDSDGQSSWSRAHADNEKDVHKEVIAGQEKVSDKVSEHKIAEHALDALPGSFKGPLTGTTQGSSPVPNALANAT